MNRVAILIFLMVQSKMLGYGFPIEVSPEEIGGHYEGDMQLSEEQMRLLQINSRSGIIFEQYRWPKSQGRVMVPFRYQNGSTYTQVEVGRIRTAMNEIENKTCVRFINQTVEVNFIEIFSGSGCWSYVGRLGQGAQLLSLMRNGCVFHGIVVHELLHALGFYHMQSSFDRDNYVRINFENVEAGREHNFRLYNNRMVSHFGTSYDYDSLLHYRSSAFSSNGSPTIETLDPKDMSRIGQRIGMSVGDVARVNNMYCS